jgi:phage FluMu gp28-like protein
MANYDMEKFFFSEEEKLQIGHELSTAIDKKTMLEEELKEVKANYKAKIEEQELQIRVNARFIKDGYEMRRVPVKEVADYKRKIMETVSEETGNVLKTRKLTSDELQRKL